MVLKKGVENLENLDIHLKWVLLVAFLATTPVEMGVTRW